MKPIETDIWEPVPDKPGMVRRVAQRPAQDVFNELYYRLETTGFLPDEYFLINSDFEKGAEYPKDAGMFCSVDYGASEGIYLDIYLKYHDEAEQKTKTVNFATGKTLGETGFDMDRMNLIASAVTKAFHEDGVHARYIILNPEENDAQNMVTFFSAEERAIVTKSLAHEMVRRKFAGEDYLQTETLLRKMTGSVTEFMKVSGLRPEQMDSFDRAVIAIHDGNIEEFETLLPEIPQNRQAEVLAVAVARPDGIGNRIMESMLAAAREIPVDTYFKICESALKNTDTEKSLMLMEHAEAIVPDRDKLFYGRLIISAMYQGGNTLASTLAEACAPEKLGDYGANLINVAIQLDNYRLFSHLVYKNGMDINANSGSLYQTAASMGNVIFIDMLKNKGADIDGQNFQALRGCMERNNLDAAKLLLDHGADFNGFVESVKGQPNVRESFVTELKGYWETEILPQQEQEQERGGMELSQ